MTQRIFLLAADQRLLRLDESQYDSEDLLQELISSYPDLLAGDQYGAEQRRWLLVQREMGVGDREDSGRRWSVDHLFIDQDARPTLVEVKRSSDTRLRREVVGQLLEYAANGTKYWPIETIRERFEARCERDGTAPDQELAGFLGSDSDADSFWGRVNDNLQLGRVRLLFVADVVPRELQRIVEFLNEQMVQTEVLAVEIKQFVGEGETRTLVPRVIGQTSAALDVKSPTASRRSRPWDAKSFLAKLESEGRAEDLPLAQSVIQCAEKAGLRWDGGRAAYKASIWPLMAGDLAPISLYEGSGRCVLHVQFNWMGSRFDSQAARQPIAGAFNRIPGVELDPERPYPGIRFDLLDTQPAQELLFEALQTTLEALRNT